MTGWPKGAIKFAVKVRAKRRAPSKWVSYDHTEPITGQKKAKRTWLVLHDGLVFGSGYYSSNIPESDVRFAVSNAIRTYETYREGGAWIDVITPDESVRTDALYPFVIDAASWTRLADGVVPDRVGQPETILDTSSRSVEDVLAELEDEGSVWVTYTFHNPATDVEQLKRSYLQLRDGLVFGSGYYILDSQVQSASHGRILEYERDGRDSTLASINTIPGEPASTYVFVADPRTGITEAQNADPGLTGTADWDAATAVLPARDILDVISRGTGMWVSYEHTNPETGQEEAKRTWLVMHDGLVFGSVYYSSDISGPAPYGSPAQQVRDGVPVHEISCNSPLSLYIRDAALPEGMPAAAVAAGTAPAGAEAAGMSGGMSADGSMLGTGTPICVSASTASILRARIKPDAAFNRIQAVDLVQNEAATRRPRQQAKVTSLAACVIKRRRFIPSRITALCARHMPVDTARCRCGCGTRHPPAALYFAARDPKRSRISMLYVVPGAVSHAKDPPLMKHRRCS